MGLFARTVGFWKDHGARATYQATVRKFRYLLATPNQAQGESAVPYDHFFRQFQFAHGAEALHSPDVQRRVNWIIPNFHRSSGGLRTLFRAALAQEQAGYEVHFYVLGETHYVSGSEAAEAIRSFYPLRAAAHLGVEDMRPAELCLATSWITAYPLRAFAACRRRIDRDC